MKRREFLAMTTMIPVGLAMSSTMAFADWTPRRPINVIVPYGAGGGTDAFARAMASASDEALPVPMVIVNKPGSSGITGAVEAQRAQPDGSMVMMTSSGSFLLTSMLRNTDVNPIDSFRVVAQIGQLTTSLMVPADGDIKTVDDLIAYGKANPGALRWGHTGRGSFHHIAGQGFLDANGIEAVDVPYKGGGGTRAAVLGKQVDFAMIGIQQLPGFESELNVLAVNDDQRDELQPDIPTFEELGHKWVNVKSPIVVYAPLETPDDVVSTLDAALKKITETAAFAEIMKQNGNHPAYKTGSDVKVFLEKMKIDAEPIIESIRE